jgi:hypothetical protein
MLCMEELQKNFKLSLHSTGLINFDIRHYFVFVLYACLRIVVCWVVAPHYLVRGYHSFGETYSLHLQGWQFYVGPQITKCLTKIPPVQWVPRFLSPGLKRDRGMTLTTHPHLVLRSWMSRSYTSSLLSASMACSGTASLFEKNYKYIIRMVIFVFLVL